MDTQLSGENRTRNFPCVQCGSQVVLLPGQNMLTCSHCGHQRALSFDENATPLGERDLQSMLQTLGQQQTADPSKLEVACRNCGAQVFFEGSLTTKACTYCSTAFVREDVHQAPSRVKVDGLLPFSFDRSRATAELGSWVNGRWFAPNAFKAKFRPESIEGTYLPYFTFDAMTFSRYRGQRGDHYYETRKKDDGTTERVRHTSWSMAHGQVQEFFDDVLISAVQSLPKQLLEDLEPWNLPQLMPYTRDAIAGFSAHTYEIELGASFEHAKRKMEAGIDRSVRRNIGGDEQRVDEIQTQWNALTYKHLLLPVWMVAYQYQGKVFRVAVNGITGKTVGQRPYSAVKIAFAVLAAIAIAITLAVVFKKR